MKLIRTEKSWQALEVDHDTDKPFTIGATPVKVSEADAKRITKLGDELGVAVVTFDEADGDEGSTPGATPDLSAGVGALTGTGDPVATTTDPTPAPAGKIKEK